MKKYDPAYSRFGEIDYFIIFLLVIFMLSAFFNGVQYKIIHRYETSIELQQITIDNQDKLITILLNDKL